MHLLGFPTEANIGGPHAYNWGSRGRRFKSCQPDWEVGASSPLKSHPNSPAGALSLRKNIATVIAKAASGSKRQRDGL